MTISVIMPLYNTERYVSAALESIFAQTLAPAEIMVVDDGSTDGSAAVVQRFLPHLRYHWQPQSGAAAALNTAVRLAQGDFLAVLDADDLWLPTKLAEQKAAFDADPDLALVFGGVEQFRSPEFYSPGQAIPPTEIFVGHIPSAMLVRQAVFGQIGGFDPVWRTGYFLDWFLRAKNAQLKMQDLPNVVAKRRLHDANLGRRKRNQQGELVKILQRDLAWRQSQESIRNDAPIV